MRQVRQVNRETFLLHARRMPLFMNPSQNTRRLTVELTLMTDTTDTTGNSKKVLAREKQTATDERIQKSCSPSICRASLDEGYDRYDGQKENKFLTHAYDMGNIPIQQSLTKTKET